MNVLKHLSRKALPITVYLLGVMHVVCLEKKPRQVGDLEIETRSYKTFSGLRAEYQIGTFYVKENRSNPNSRLIGIGFSRFGSKNSKAPPVFFLPGGPGSSFLDSIPPEIHRTEAHCWGRNFWGVATWFSLTSAALASVVSYWTTRLSSTV